MKYILTVLLAMSSVFALTTEQKEVRRIVLDEASKWSNYKSTIAGICLTESSLGYYSIGDDGKSLGAMQIQLSTARDYAKRIKQLRYILQWDDKTLGTKLLKDLRFSVKVATLIFEYNRKRYGYFEAISRYNGGRSNTSYFTKVQSNKHWLMKQKEVMVAHRTTTQHSTRSL